MSFKHANSSNWSVPLTSTQILSFTIAPRNQNSSFSCKKSSQIRSIFNKFSQLKFKLLISRQNQTQIAARFSSLTLSFSRYQPDYTLARLPTIVPTARRSSLAKNTSRTMSGEKTILRSLTCWLCTISTTVASVLFAIVSPLTFRRGGWNFRNLGRCCLTCLNKVKFRHLKHVTFIETKLQKIVGSN